MISDEELIKRSLFFNGCHFIDLKIRRDGHWIEQEGDWIKYILQELMERRGLKYPKRDLPKITPNYANQESDQPTSGKETV